MRKKIGSLIIEITTKHFLLRTANYILFGIAWANPRCLIIMADRSKIYCIGPALLHFDLSFGYMPDIDITGIDLRLEIFGKGFTYTKEYHSDRTDLPVHKHFGWIK